MRQATSHPAGLENNMNAKRRVQCIAAIWALVLVLLTMVACGTLPDISITPSVAILLDTPMGTSDPATLAAALTQEKNYVNNQAAATAEIVRANAQATLVAAGSTQSAALTEDAFRQTQVQEQQNKDAIAAGTRTAVANLIATQTQSAVATSQWYADQSRQREEQRKGQIALLWMWCLPVLVVLFAGLCLWGFWRWMKIQQNRQRITEQPIEKLQAPVDPDKPQDGFLPPESDLVNGRHRLTQPDEQMRGWLDEIKRKLLNRGKDDDGNPDS
jgi:hypothetical protein